jgi:hypothetical protein
VPTGLDFVATVEQLGWGLKLAEVSPFTKPEYPETLMVGGVPP